MVAVVAALGVAACGSSGSSGAAASSNPTTLLSQTFSAKHTVKSGILQVSLVVVPTGSSELTTPLSLSLRGPFQSRGAGKPPESAFTIGFSALGKSGSFGVTTTASGAYISIEGTNYQLPSSEFQKLRSTLGSSSSSGSAPGLSSLGINPESWLSRPQIVGTQTVDGVVTEHLHAAVDISAFVRSLNRVLTKESSTLKSTGTGVERITSAMARKIAAEVRDPTVDVWTGKNDSTLRRLQIGATVPISGSLSSELGGLSSATFRLTLNYAQLGKPQTIAAPTDVHGYAQLQAKLVQIVEGLRSTFDDGVGSTGGGTTTTSSSASAGSVSKYAKCINGAKGDVSKMQKCAALLKGG
jgi:hypothetical protein